MRIILIFRLLSFRFSGSYYILTTIDLGTGEVRITCSETADAAHHSTRLQVADKAVYIQHFQNCRIWHWYQSRNNICEFASYRIYFWGLTALSIRAVLLMTTRLAAGFTGNAYEGARCVGGSANANPYTADGDGAACTSGPNPGQYFPPRCVDQYKPEHGRRQQSSCM